MKKILRAGLCLLLAASSFSTVRAEDMPVAANAEKPAMEKHPERKDRLPDPEERTAVSFIAAEVPTIVQLSRHDINRIVCSGPMSDLIYSEEKGVTGHFSGNNAFIKFKAEEVNGELIYPEVPSELFVVCNGAVYTLIAEPHDILSVTLHLASPAQETLEKNIALYKNLPLEKQALQIIRQGYEGGYPSSYKVARHATSVAVSPDLNVTLMQTVDVEGVGLRLKQYRAASTRTEPLELQEKTFLSPGVSDSILAVAIDNHVLNPGEATRVFVVEKKELEQR